MIVKELIAALEKYDENCEVVYCVVPWETQPIEGVY